MQTAVEWLIKEFNLEKFTATCELALQKEKEQMFNVKSSRNDSWKLIKRNALIKNEKSRLRKVKNEYGEYYFHKWVEYGDLKRHPENPFNDIIYVKTFALLEDVKTGKCGLWDPESVIFIK